MGFVYFEEESSIETNFPRKFMGDGDEESIREHEKDLCDVHEIYLH